MSLRTPVSFLFLALGAAIGVGQGAGASPDSRLDTPDFERDVAPLLIQRCLECHKDPDPAGRLNLATVAGMRSGGDSGPAMTGSDAPTADDSMLLQRVAAGEMPPPQHGESRALPAEEVDILRRWVAAGAPFPAGRVLDLYERSTATRGGRDLWSLQPLADVSPPSSETNSERSLHPIDAFIREKLAEHQLTPAPPAAPDVLLRRLHHSLTGLPPSASEVDEFVARGAQGEDIVTQKIDQLLASPHFGERWARHWLDVVRYADTSGYERDQPKPFAWKYRDWVVSAFNSDKPYDEFIRQQLAGDELPDRSESSVVATGFLRLGTWNDEPNDPEDYQYERLEDLVHTTSSAFLALTVKCARCHDHKFDPIPQADYYRMAAVFWPGPIAARERELLGGPSNDELGVTDVLGWTDITRSPLPLHALKNGERHRPLQAVTPATMTCVPAEFHEFTAAPAGERSNGLRRQLADWIASSRNPLTARVIVNRLWQHHFGDGLVRSSDNFGFMGDRPTHPELLDWLAGELIRSGWSLKHMHRLILTSATWQQASVHPRQNDYAQIDALNQWLWRANRRRLDAEALRDAMLLASGELDLRAGGPGFVPTVSQEALEGLSKKDAAWSPSPESEQRRRSLYMFVQRSLLPPMMTAFDLCDSTQPCARRDVTIVAPQALTLLNNSFIHDRAAALARTALQSGGSDAAITELWRSVLKREPTDAERTLAARHLADQQRRLTSAASESASVADAPRDAAASLALVLLNSNEFAFVD
jgi:hypothetical protein